MHTRGHQRSPFLFQSCLEMGLMHNQRQNCSKAMNEEVVELQSWKWHWHKEWHSALSLFTFSPCPSRSSSFLPILTVLGLRDCLVESQQWQTKEPWQRWEEKCTEKEKTLQKGNAKDKQINQDEMDCLSKQLADISEIREVGMNCFEKHFVDVSRWSSSFPPYFYRESQESLELACFLDLWPQKQSNPQCLLPWLRAMIQSSP